MRMFIMRKMQEMSEHDSKNRSRTPSIMHTSENTLDKDENTRQNEKIFKGLTFDGQGNPLTIAEPNMDNLNPSHVQPKYKVTKHVLSRASAEV